MGSGTSRKKSLSRRDFLKVGGAGVAGLALAGCGGGEQSGGVTEIVFSSSIDDTGTAKVLTHPRCVNCHPHDDQPRQRERAEVHNPPVVRGPDNHGVPALTCGSCHQDHNLDHARVPGAPDWHLAPLEMAWLGRTPAAICAQIKDPKRNGGKSLAQIAEHTAHDKLVGWGWSPGADREPVPGSQARFGALVAAWIETGAACPEEETRR